jgi:hypothetical protein
MGATTRRGGSAASSKVGDRVGRAVDENTAAAFVPDASTGDTCGDDKDEGLRANVRELSLPADGDDPAALPLRRDWIDDALRSMPGLRLSDVPEGTLRRLVAPGNVAAPADVFVGLVVEVEAGGVGRGRAVRALDAGGWRTLGDEAAAAFSGLALIGEEGVANPNFSGL